MKQILTSMLHSPILVLLPITQIPSNHEVTQISSENGGATSYSVNHSEKLSSSSWNLQSQDNVMHDTSGHTLSTTNDTTPLLLVFSPEQL
ncbi:hypothetical protein ACFX15_034603 [Malus domestica]